MTGLPGCEASFVILFPSCQTFCLLSGQSQEKSSTPKTAPMNRNYMIPRSKDRAHISADKLRPMNPNVSKSKPTISSNPAGQLNQHSKRHHPTDLIPTLELAAEGVTLGEDMQSRHCSTRTRNHIWRLQICFILWEGRTFVACVKRGTEEAEHLKGIVMRAQTHIERRHAS